MDAVVETRSHVQALQSGDPDQIRAASQCLVRLQKNASAQFCASLLEQSIGAGDQASAFFAAQTLATHARLRNSDEWATLVRLIIAVFQDKRVHLVVIRQLAITLARLAVWLSASWPGLVVEVIEAQCSSGVPSLELLHAFAEEPFSRRLLVDGSCRSRFLLVLRGQVGAFFAAIGCCGSSRPSAALRCATAWFRALSCFEEWLPMVGLAGGTDSALRASASSIDVAILAAQLKLDFEDLEASAEFFEASLSVIEVVSEDVQRTLLPLLNAFMDSCTRVLSGTLPMRSASVGDLADVFAGVVKVSFSSKALLRGGCLSTLLPLAAQMLSTRSDGWDILRSFDAWEALSLTLQQEPNQEELMSAAFGHLLCAMPQALLLPPETHHMSEDLAGARCRLPQLFVMWCDGSETRTHNLLSALRCLMSRNSSAGNARWAEVELVFVIATAVAEVLANNGQDDLHELLSSLLGGLPSLHISTSPKPWSDLAGTAAAEFVATLDPWITQQRCVPEATRELWVFLFDLAERPGSAEAAVRALTVVVSNLAPALAVSGVSPDGRAVLGRLRHLSFGVNGLTPPLRERLLRSAMGPLLSHLSAAELGIAMEELLAPLRVHVTDRETDIASRLMFHLIAAPQSANTELALGWLSTCWSWFEKTLVRGVVEPVDAACHALTSILARGRSHDLAASLFGLATPMLVGAGLRSNAEALGALSSLVRIFKGGRSVEQAKTLGAHLVSLARGLLSSAEQARQLPPDLFAAVLETVAVAMGHHCIHLAPQLVQSSGFLVELVSVLASALPTCTSPRAVCWGLHVLAKLPAWCSQELLKTAVPHAATMLIGLLAFSPLVLDMEVSPLVVQTVLQLTRALPATLDALRGAMTSVGIATEEVELLSQQITDPSLMEEALAEQLQEAASSWQADHLRRSLLS